MFVECLARDQINRDAGEGGKNAVDGQQPPGRGIRIDSENLEDASDQVGIQRGFPCRGAGIISVRIAETLAQRDRAGDASHLPAEGKVIFAGAGAVLVGNPD